MLVTYRGYQFDTANRGDLLRLAAATPAIGPNFIDRVLDEIRTQDEIDRAVWAELLWQGPGSLTAYEQAGGAR